MIARNRGGLMAWLDRRAVTRMVGVPLPAAASDIRYVRWQASSDLAYYEAVIRFSCSKEAYLAFVGARGMTSLSVSGPNVYLPASWQPAPDMQQPDWWGPAPTTPPDAASAAVGSDGSIVAKWEGGHTFVMIIDTGHRATRQDAM